MSERLERNGLTLNTTERKLLYGIYETQWETLKALQEIKSLLVPATAEQTAVDIDSLKRGELIAKVKALPDKPDGWFRLSNAELIGLLKEGE